MDGVRAWELLQDHSYCGSLSMDGFKRLLLRAGYSPSLAHSLAKQRGWDRLCAGEML